MERRALLSGAAAAAALAAEADVPVIDYGRSFLSGVAAWNRVRFWIESRTRVTDEKTGKHEDYFQCASCKSENTFAERDLFHRENYDFLPVFGPEFGVIFRRYAHANPNYREVRATKAMWGGQTHGVNLARKAELLATTAAVRKATHAGFPLVAQTEFQRAGVRVVIEYPVKTINIHDENDRYQVDTGPVAFPDLTASGRIADRLWLAFVAFNAPHFTDFILEDVTKGNVRHYSRIVNLQARNRLYAVRA